MVGAPRATLCTASSDEQPRKGGQPAAGGGGQPIRAEPFAVYDYLRIKEESQPEDARKEVPIQMCDAIGRNLAAPPPGQQAIHWEIIRHGKGQTN